MSVAGNPAEADDEPRDILAHRKVEWHQGEAGAPTQEIVRTRGRSPRGLLVYRADGGMTVQVMDGERQRFAIGRFEVRPSESAVVHHIEGSLLPNEVGQSRTRLYALDGDRLTLTTPPFDAHGERRTLVIIWDRVR